MFTPPRHQTLDRGLENSAKRIRIEEVTSKNRLYPFNPSPQDAKRIADRRRDPRFNDKCSKVKFYKIDDIRKKCADDSNFLKNKTSDTRDYKELPNDVCVKLFRFVITEIGELVCGSNNEAEEYSHGAMVDYAAVFAAGEFGADKQGNILYVSNRTGHYCVPPESLSERVYPYLIDILGYTLEQIQAFYEGAVAHGEIIDGEAVITHSCSRVGEKFAYSSTGRIEGFGQATSSNHTAVAVSLPASSPKSRSSSALYQQNRVNQGSANSSLGYRTP
ncbi:MAG: hypothetical protein KBD83_01145 [Gammaproteobacteria bacterium]|nr:hypothetical protein [Gammaproteobacteria bacterium]